MNSDGDASETPPKQYKHVVFECNKCRRQYVWSRNPRELPNCVCGGSGFSTVTDRRSAVDRRKP